MQSPCESQLWCPGPSLWTLITKHVPGSEVPKIHTALGPCLVDMYAEVHKEAEIWHTMWQESQRVGNHGSRARTPLSRQQVTLLADPPAVKELVRAEVKMLLQSLRERASSGGRDPEEVLLRYNPNTVNYALGHLDSCYNNCADPEDTDNGSRPSSCCSTQSKAEEEIEAVRDKLNVTDIDQVVDRLKYVLMEECTVLNRMIMHFKENIKEKCRGTCEFDKSEPTLGELRELRGAVQMDLDVYPTSFSTSSTPLCLLPVKEMKNRFRPLAGQKDSDESLQALTAASVLSPHPLFYHTTPRPPVGPRLTKTSVSVRPVYTASLSRPDGEHRSTSASNKSCITPLCNKITTPGHTTSKFATNQIMSKSKQHSRLSPEHNCAGLHSRTHRSGSSFSLETQQNSPIHEARLSSHHSLLSLSKEYDLSPQRGRKSRSKNISISPSSVDVLGPLSDASSYTRNGTDHFVSTTGKSKTQNGHPKSACGGSLASITLQMDNDSRKSTSESFHSPVMCETGGPSAHNCSTKSNSGIDRDEKGNLVKDVNQQQSLCSHCLTNGSSHLPANSGEQGQAKCIQPSSNRIHGQFFTCPKRLLGGSASQHKSVQEAQSELQFINKFYQPVPPASVPT